MAPPPTSKPKEKAKFTIKNQVPSQIPPIYDGSRLVLYKQLDKNYNVGDHITSFKLIIMYCESVICRHSLFSKYFGEPINVCGDKCDACLNPSETLGRLKTFQTKSCIIDQRVSTQNTPMQRMNAVITQKFKLE